jgi:5-methyltetrahydrofolate--homocysteine methyltransferase
MEKGVAVLEPMLLAGRKQQTEAVVILATVKGDIHDIGKNLVGLMMKNHGIQVIDLGKDVDKEEIIRQAVAHQADVIALSALMTTTMCYMKEVITAVKEHRLTAKIIVGGAALTAEYAQEIGADGYSADAVAAVALVKSYTDI